MCISWAGTEDSRRGTGSMGDRRCYPQSPTACLHARHSSVEDTQSAFCRGQAEDTSFAQERKDGLDHLPPKDPKSYPNLIIFFLSKWTTKSIQR